MMPPPYSLRRYRPEDFDQVAALAVEACSRDATACGQPDVRSVDEFRVDYEHRPLEDEAWVAVESTGEVVGFAIAKLRNQTLSLDGPIVAPSAQSQGIGRMLLDRFEADAVELGATAIEGGVRRSNRRGWRFLRALGYQPSREIFCYEQHQCPTEKPLPGAEYTLGELKPKTLLPFLMLMHECFPDYRLPSNPQRLFEPDKMKIFLAFDKSGTPVGAVTAFYYPEDRLGYIYNLGVSEPHRRTGLARTLLLAACHWLWEHHAPRFVGLSTDDREGVRRGLYERSGFTSVYALAYALKRL